MQDNQVNPRIKPLDIEEEMKKSFIAYAMAVIINRALPDVRDGLKPVHRRILYSMDEQGFTADKPFHKSARIVGDVLGKYHPHGDRSVYDAMVRLAQDFNTRYMLVEGQGNFGSIDGDSAAAMRYTEARLSKLSAEMMADIGKNTVDFMPNFDETLMQPTVLPCRYPNLLVNGSGGIAVGMATNIPPHNLGEVIDAYVAMIDNPDISIEELMAYIPGPDFPTGGLIMGAGGIRQAYRTGRGKVVVRARAEVEPMAGGKSRIVITEIPYQVNKARLVEKIADLIHEKRVDGIQDLRDESDRRGIRVVIDLKKDVNGSVVLNQLYKHTQLQDTFGVIMIALVDGEPKVLNLKEMLYHYLRFQEQVVTRRTQYDLERAKERLHILEGLLIALANIDEVVDIIKTSPTTQAAKERLCSHFGLSDKQAQAILDMRLARLTGLEQEKIQAEHDELSKLVAYYESILADETKLLGIIKEEILEVRRKYADPRRTEITQVTEDIDLDDVIQEEDMVVTMTHFGYVKRLAADTYRAQNRGGRGVLGQATREEDFVEHLFAANTHDFIMFFTNRGRAFKVKCYTIPEAGRSAKGTAIVNLLQLQAGEKVTAIFPVTAQAQGEYLVLATRQGVIKKTPLSDFDNIRKGGLIALNLREEDELIGVMLSTGQDEFLVGTQNGMCIRFHEDDVRPMGRTATGVRSILLDEGDQVVDVEKVIPGQTVLSITERGMGKRTDEAEYRCQRRGGRGVIAMNLTEKTGRLVCMRMVQGDEDVMMIRDDGTVMRMPVEQIRVISRNTQGVKLMQVPEGARVASVALVAPESPDSPQEDPAD
ncbi:MAG TPA: DNA gyrase subunit A [Candidatus Pelethousia gallinarum]|nr:DNA gyrase subunit A [Candidatus Pelethousia gallinarum]